MEKQTWKVIAIIFMIITILETTIFIWSFISLSIEEKQIAKCYYDICNDYPEADLSGDVCYCYDYDMLGELQIVDTKYMK